MPLYDIKKMLLFENVTIRRKKHITVLKVLLYKICHFMT